MTPATAQRTTDVIRPLCCRPAAVRDHALCAQTNIDLGGISADPNAPVEVTADNLNVDQDTGSGRVQRQRGVGAGRPAAGRARGAGEICGGPPATSPGCRQRAA